MNVIVHEVEEVSDLFIRRLLGQPGPATNGMIDAGELLRSVPKGTMRRNERMCYCRRILNHQLQILFGWATRCENRILKRF